MKGRNLLEHCVSASEKSINFEDPYCQFFVMCFIGCQLILFTVVFTVFDYVRRTNLAFVKDVCMKTSACRSLTSLVGHLSLFD